MANKEITVEFSVDLLSEEIVAMSQSNTENQNESLTLEQNLEMFKFFEESADKTKSYAYSQTTWLLTLNAGIVAFSLNLYVQHKEVPGFLLIEFIAAFVGVVLCVFLYFLLLDFGFHISGDWTKANKIAANNPRFVEFLSTKEDEVKPKKPSYPALFPKFCRRHYPALFPKFCRRLQFLAILFLIAHISWTCIAAFLVACSPSNV